MSEESRDPVRGEDESGATDPLFTPPDLPETPADEPEAAPESSPPTPDSANTAPPSAPVAPVAPVAEARAAVDRGPNIARGVLIALLSLGGLLIARGPQGPAASSPAAVLTGAEVPGSAAPSASGSAAAATPTTTAASIAAVPDAGPRPPPAWRVVSLDRDASVEILKGTLGKHTFAGALSQAGISKQEIRRVTHAIDGMRRLEKGQSRDSFVVARDRTKGSVVAFEYITSPTDIWQGKSEDGLSPKKLELYIERKRATAALVVTADLRKAISAAGLREEAIEEIDEALDGRGDLAVVKPGVRLRVVGAEEWVEGTFARFRIAAVEYVPKAGDKLRVYHYERDASVEGSRRRAPHPGFYDGKGQQPFRGTFRSPLPLTRVTSRFNPRRMHPVLHTVMPHNGVDFGASTGTPVFASAPGSVASVGDGGRCGNMIQIDHASGLSTAYCHLSRFAPGLHPGQHVEARQLVGFVGQTGSATGPHLHFAVKRGGNFIDPMALKMDGVRTLPSADRDAFSRRRSELDAALDAIALPSVDGVVVPDEKDEKDEPAGEE